MMGMGSTVPYKDQRDPEYDDTLTEKTPGDPPLSDYGSARRPTRTAAARRGSQPPARPAAARAARAHRRPAPVRPAPVRPAPVRPAQYGQPQYGQPRTAQPYGQPRRHAPAELPRLGDPQHDLLLPARSASLDRVRRPGQLQVRRRRPPAPRSLPQGEAVRHLVGDRGLVSSVCTSRCLSSSRSRPTRRLKRCGDGTASAAGTGRAPALGAPLATAAAALAALPSSGWSTRTSRGTTRRARSSSSPATGARAAAALRAMHALAHGDIPGALGMNVLAVAFVRPRWSSGFAGWCALVRRQPRPRPAPPAVIWGVAALVVVFWVVRNLPIGSALAP